MKIESFINLVAVAVISAYLGGKAQEKKDIQATTVTKAKKPVYRSYSDYYDDRRTSQG